MSTKESSKRFLKLGTTLNLMVIVFLAVAPFAWSQEGQVSVSARKPVDFSAFAQVRYSAYSSGVPDTFSLRRVRLAFSAAVLNNLEFKVQLEQTKSLALIDTYFNFHLGDWGELRAGQFKIPFSYENLKSASEQDFINRSSVVEALCPGRDIGSQGRDIGAMFRLHSSFFEAFFGLFNGSGINRLDNDEHKDKAFRLTLNLWRGFTLGGSWYEGLWPEVTNTSSRLRRRQGLEAQLKSGSLALGAEYIKAFDYEQTASGWVFQASLSLRQGMLQPVFRYESLDRSLTLKDNEERVLSYGLNIHFAPRTKIQINQEAHQLKGEAKRKNIYLLQFQIGF